jgi:hypothetical protein
MSATLSIAAAPPFALAAPAYRIDGSLRPPSLTALNNQSRITLLVINVILVISLTNVSPNPETICPKRDTAIYQSVCDVQKITSDLAAQVELRLPEHISIPPITRRAFARQVSRKLFERLSQTDRRLSFQSAIPNRH